MEGDRRWPSSASHPPPPSIPSTAMTTKTLTRSWEESFRLLTALPAPLQEDHGDANFMRASRFRHNGRRLFEEKILPLIEEGKDLVVLSGFVDATVSEEFSAHGENLPGAAEFRSARLFDTKSGDTFDLVVD